MVIEKRILLIENSSTDFYKARIPYAKYLLNKGYKVFAFIPNDGLYNYKTYNDITIFYYDLKRKDKNILNFFKTIYTLKKIIIENQIQIIHSYRFLPNLINTLSNFFNKKKVIIHITGLGIIFSNNDFIFKFYKIFIQIVFQVKFLRANKIIFQNYDDINDIFLKNIWVKKFNVVKGSGVDINKFSILNYNKKELRSKFNITNSEIIFICVTRLIWEKGIKEMIDAFQELKNNNCILWIIGWSDSDNPRCINQQYINIYKNHSNIKFLGRLDDIKEYLAASDVYLYPSYYREGIPRSILEALSMSLPIVTTDTPGCNLTVINNQNGFLIKPKSTSDIIRVINNLLNPKIRYEMSTKSRLLVEKEFQNDVIFTKLEKLYNS